MRNDQAQPVTDQHGRRRVPPGWNGGQAPEKATEKVTEKATEQPADIKPVNKG